MTQERPGETGVPNAQNDRGDSPEASATPQYEAPQYQQPQYQAPQSQAPQYGAPGYGSGSPYPGAPVGMPYAAPIPAPATNTISILALVSAFIAPFVVPVVLGHIGLGQIRRTGEGGRGIAITALVLGYIQLAFWAILIGFIIWVGVVAAASSGASY